MRKPAYKETANFFDCVSDFFPEKTLLGLPARGKNKKQIAAILKIAKTLDNPSTSVKYAVVDLVLALNKDA
jgi:hypothetical protein